MDTEEKDICSFLETIPGQYVSAREIARRAGGKWRFREDPNWPGPALLRLIESGVVHCDAAGRYSLAEAPKRRMLPRWISPQMKKILEESGKDFGEGLGLDGAGDSKDR
jgi:hypothetical protein